MEDFLMKNFYYFFYLILLNIFLLPLNNASPLEKELILHYQNRPPYFIDSSQGKLIDGILYKNIEKVMKQAKIKYTYDRVPFARSLYQIKEGKENICVTYAYKTQERQKYAVYTEPIYKDEKIAIAIRKGDSRFQNYTTLKEIMKNSSLVPMIRIGYSYGDYIDELILNFKNYKADDFNTRNQEKIKDTSKDPEYILTSVASKEIDYSFWPKNELSFLIKQSPNLKNELETKDLRDVQTAQYRHLLCSKSVNSEDIEKINKAIKQVLK